MLVAYRTGLILATPRLRKVVVTAAIGIVLFDGINIGNELVRLTDGADLGRRDAAPRRLRAGG